MRALFLFTMLICLEAATKGYGQTISLELQNTPLEKALREITSQTGFSFIYTRAQLKNAQPVTVQLKDASIKDVLDKCFANQPLWYTIEDKYVVILDRERKAVSPKDTLHIEGIILSETGETLEGVTIASKLTGKLTLSSKNGNYKITGIPSGDVLIITCIGYNKLEVPVEGRNNIIVRLRIAEGNLDEAIVIAYGKTSKRLTTGNVSKIASQQIKDQPVTNPLGALYGRVPGLVLSQSNGLPGASFNIRIRGQNSIDQGSEPLFIIDGIPYAPNNTGINVLSSILDVKNGKGISPFASIDPSTIESIEVLKDADATAIYGSRGANGVILITTKKGKQGKTQINFSVNAGFSKVTKYAEMMDTKEYLAMRKEAFKNDGITPSTDPTDQGFAPDLLIWDTSINTNWQKKFIGNTAGNTDAIISVSGGSEQTQFLINGTIHRETTVFPTGLNYKRAGINSSISHTSADRRLQLEFRNISSFDQNNLITVGGSSFVNMIPNMPALIDSNGALLWESAGVQFNSNPYAFLRSTYTASTQNIINNISIRYQLYESIGIKLNAGYNSIHLSDNSSMPIAIQNPNNNPTGNAGIGKNQIQSWIIEPQVEYNTQFLKNKMTVLTGASWQENKQSSSYTNAEGYTSDDLLGSLAAAPTIRAYNSFSDYKYLGAFVRITNNWSNKYLLSLSARRDGSSRFGPSKQFSNFGSVGAAWIFTNEQFSEGLNKVISFGKLRASYGLTGNDQIGNYKYLDSWESVNYSYQGTVGLYPTGIFNNTYSWEKNKKLEISLDLGFIEDRISLSATYFKNRSDNQLVSYILPTQTGFTSIIRNFPAVVNNTGIELELNSKIIKSKSVSWNVNFNLSVPRNKLVSFPGIESSSYASVYVEKKSLDVIYKIKSLGVDPATGVFSFLDVNKDNAISEGYSGDYIVGRDNLIRYYGGLSSGLTYKKVRVSVLFEFRRQTGQTLLYSIYQDQRIIPGTMNNQPAYLLNRWQKAGDITLVQQVTATPASAAYEQTPFFLMSDGVYGDASFVRLKNVSVSYALTGKFTDRLKLGALNIFCAAQNFLTLSRYLGTDPESQDFFSVSPLKTIEFGLSMTF